MNLEEQLVNFPDTQRKMLLLTSGEWRQDKELANMRLMEVDRMTKLFYLIAAIIDDENVMRYRQYLLNKRRIN